MIILFRKKNNCLKNIAHKNVFIATFFSLLSSVFYIQLCIWYYECELISRNYIITTIKRRKKKIIAILFISHNKIIYLFIKYSDWYFNIENNYGA